MTLVVCMGLVAPLATLLADPAGVGSASPAPHGPAEELATASQLLALRQAGPADPLANAVALADAATAGQLAAVGLALPDARAAAHAAPSAAAGALLDAHGAAPSPPQAAQLAALDALPGAARVALARFVDSFLAMDLATQAGLAGLGPAALGVPSSEGPAPRPQDVWASAGIDLAPALAARGAFLEAALALRDALSLVPPGLLPDRVETSVLVLDFTVADNTYTRDLRLVWDAGGDDVYLNNAGGGFLGAAALVDLAGNDQFASGHRQGVNGGAKGGLGVLLDQAGDDVYLAGDDGTNGGGYLGAGLLLDAGGSDLYAVTGWGANGGAYPGGIGLLVDDGEGADRYTGWYEGVNGGAYLGGSGLLYDAGGDDAYEATWSNVNGGTLGGHALLLDGGGNDRYTAQHGAVNGGGAGLLYDAGGTDTYLDQEGGSGVDRTVVPKAGAGAQVDG
jgi:hypothetical protein